VQPASFILHFAATPRRGGVRRETNIRPFFSFMSKLLGGRLFFCVLVWCIAMGRGRNVAFACGRYCYHCVHVVLYFRLCHCRGAASTLFGHPFSLTLPLSSQDRELNLSITTFFPLKCRRRPTPTPRMDFASIPSGTSS